MAVRTINCGWLLRLHDFPSASDTDWTTQGFPDDLSDNSKCILGAISETLEPFPNARQLRIYDYTVYNFGRLLITFDDTGLKGIIEGNQYYCLAPKDPTWNAWPLDLAGKRGLWPHPLRDLVTFQRPVSTVSLECAKKTRLAPTV